MPWHQRRSAGCHTPTEWIAVDALLSLACPSRATSSLTCSAWRLFFSFSACVPYACVVTHTPHNPSERRVGRTARMTMSFGYVADGRCCIRFATRYARAPLDGGERGHPVWSSHVESHFLFVSPSLPLRAGSPPRRAQVPREGHYVDPALNEQASTNL
jgi:hypothetical protein